MDGMAAGRQRHAIKSVLPLNTLDAMQHAAAAASEPSICKKKAERRPGHPHTPIALMAAWPRCQPARLG
jgi:hypothetical protein